MHYFPKHKRIKADELHISINDQHLGKMFAGVDNKLPVAKIVKFTVSSIIYARINIMHILVTVKTCSVIP